MSRSSQYVVGKPYNPTEVFELGEGEGPDGIKRATIALRVYDWTIGGASLDGTRKAKAHALATRIAAFLNGEENT